MGDGWCNTCGKVGRSRAQREKDAKPKARKRSWWESTGEAGDSAGGTYGGSQSSGGLAEGEAGSDQGTAPAAGDSEEGEAGSDQGTAPAAGASASTEAGAEDQGAATVTPQRFYVCSRTSTIHKHQHQEQTGQTGQEPL